MLPWRLADVGQCLIHESRGHPEGNFDNSFPLCSSHASGQAHLRDQAAQETRVINKESQSRPSPQKGEHQRLTDIGILRSRVHI